jgi:hypothetical protein
MRSGAAPSKAVIATGATLFKRMAAVATRWARGLSPI